MDWESDPELIQIRSEFIKSLSERAVALKNCCDTILKVGLTDDTVRELAFIAHRLAGIAETYGFSVVGNIAEKLDGWLSSSEIYKQPPKEVVRCVSFLEEALHRVIETESNPQEMLEDQRMRDLIFFFEAIRD